MEGKKGPTAATTVVELSTGGGGSLSGKGKGGQPRWRVSRERAREGECFVCFIYNKKLS